MKWYRCKDCGAMAFGEENLKFKHYESDFCDAYPALRGKPICPECESEDLETLNACDMCNEPTQDDKHELCETCTCMAKDITEYASKKWNIDLHALVCLLDDYESDGRIARRK